MLHKQAPVRQTGVSASTSGVHIFPLRYRQLVCCDRWAASHWASSCRELLVGNRLIIVRLGRPQSLGPVSHMQVVDRPLTWFRSEPRSFKAPAAAAFLFDCRTK